MAVTWWGEDLQPYDHPYNDTAKNERAVELAAAFRWLQNRDPSAGLEVGNVLSHYRPAQHRIIDRWEEAEGVENLDVFDVRGEYPWVVAISTLEHVRLDEPEQDQWGAVRALFHLRTLVQEGGGLFVTVPLGWNMRLDDYLLRWPGCTRACTFVREGGGWVQTPELTWMPYGRTTIWADSVWIGEWEG